VVDPTRNMLPGAGQEWFSVQNWAAVDQDGLAGVVMPLDSQLMTFGDINRGVWPAHFGTRPGTIFSYVLNNYHQPRALVDWPEKSPEDRFQFRYVVTSAAAVEPVALSRLGWEMMTPLEQDEVQPQDKSFSRPSNLDPGQGSFIEVNDPALLLATWKPAEDGQGTILRLLDLGGAPRTVPIGLPLEELSAAEQCDAVERKRSDLPLTDPHHFNIAVHPHEIITIRLLGKPTAAPHQSLTN